MRPEEIREALSFDDILLLPTDKSEITSRKNVDTSTKISRNVTIKYPIISSPMDTISDVKTCIALNKIGAAGILHRFMSIATQHKKAKEIVKECGFCYLAIGLQDYEERIETLYNAMRSEILLFVLDTANGSNIQVENFLKWYNDYKWGLSRPDIIVGNTLTKASVSRAINLKCDGIRHGIGIGSCCTTTEVTGIGCPPVTALYYGWKAIRNYELENKDIGKDNLSPTLLLDGGIRKPADLVKSLVCGADAVICGGIFAGCKETPGEIINKIDNITGRIVQYKRFRGQASKSVVEEYGLWDGTSENLFVEGKETEVQYTGESVVDVVYKYVNGLRSAMAYLGFANLQEMKGSLWENRCLAVRI